jgi:glucan biosynthesis protein C
MSATEGESVARSPPKKQLDRLYFADNLRTWRITLFRERINWSGSFARGLQRHSYTVYVTQSPIIVFVAIALMGLSIEHLLKFGLAAVITVPLCFVTAYLVLKIPYASMVL